MPTTRPLIYPSLLERSLAIAYKLREYISEHATAIRGMAGSPFVEATLSKWTMKEIEDEGMATQFGYASRHEVREGWGHGACWQGCTYW